MKPAVLDRRHDDLHHTVHFYEHEHELVASVTRYLSDGIRRGEVAIVIATAEHRAAFGEELARLGLADAPLIALDAAETLAGFMIDGRVDAASFEATVGAFVRDRSKSGETVRAFGEMVALLWAEGNVTGAIELEDAWNGLLRDVSFSLYCAYPTTVAADGAPAEAVDEICRLHSGVTGRGGPETRSRDQAVPEREATTHFVASPRAPMAARRFVADALGSEGLDGALYQIMVVVSELSTNAVRHAASDFSVTVLAGERIVFVGVRDSSPSPPVLHASSDLATSGRGLALVDALADRWGCERSGSGKLVWAEFSRDRGQPT